MIPHNHPLITEDDKRAVLAVLASNHVAGGPQVAGLEGDFRLLLKGGQACAVSSGTAALFLALRGLGISPGSRVAVPTYACSALLNAVNMLQADAVPVDVTVGDFTISPLSLVEQASGADAVIAVHTFGAAANISGLRKSGAKIIEDCCQSLGGPQGRDGDCSVFSFYATKIVTGGHGGLVWDQTGSVAASAHDYRDFDCRETYLPRFNFHMTDIQAAMIRSQLSRIDDIRERRRLIFDTYRAALPSGLKVQGGLEAPDVLPYRFVIRTPDKKLRDEIKRHFAEQGVATIVPVERYELLHRYMNLNPESYPVAEHIVDTTLSVPIYPGLHTREVDTVLQAIKRLG